VSLYRLLLLSSHIFSKFESSFTIRLDNWNRLFGTMAFICVFVSLLMGLLIMKGRTLRKYNLVDGKTEDGVQMFVPKRGSEAYDVHKMSSKVAL